VVVDLTAVTTLTNPPDVEVNVIGEGTTLQTAQDPAAAQYPSVIIVVTPRT
jgi:hypothetical protein